MTKQTVAGPLCAILCAFAILTTSGALYAQQNMSNADLIKLTKSGLSEDFITNLIDQQGSRLSSDVSSLIEMKREGVNERILEAVIRKSPPSEKLNSDSIVRLAKAQFSDN